MTSVERTAYRVFPRLMTTRELYVFYSPTQDQRRRQPATRKAAVADLIATVHHAWQAQQRGHRRR